MSEITKAAEGGPLERVAEYIPFGAKDSIKLSCGIVRSLLSAPTKEGHECSDTDAMKFIMMCRSRKLNPFEGDAFLVGYDTRDGPKFSLITAHQAFLKRAENHPEYDGMESGLIVREKDGTVHDIEGDFYQDAQSILGAWAVVYFKNRSHPMRKRIKFTTFRKPFGRWIEDPAGMIVKCAEADALRSSFPTLLGSLYLHEELGSDQLGGEDRSNDKLPVGRTKIRKPKEPAAAVDAEVQEQPRESSPEPESAGDRPEEESSASLFDDAGATQPTSETEQTQEPVDKKEPPQRVPREKRSRPGKPKDPEF